jgi:hypothetical protein
VGGAKKMYMLENKMQKAISLINRIDLLLQTRKNINIQIKKELNNLKEEINSTASSHASSPSLSIEVFIDKMNSYEKRLNEIERKIANVFFQKPPIE